MRPGPRRLTHSVHRVVKYWCSIFEQAGIPDAKSSAQTLASHVYGQKLWATTKCTKLSSCQLAELHHLCEQRLKRVPLQYIIGEWDFRDITLKLHPPVLIPRPETEELVELVLQDLEKNYCGGADILEIGCGSGAICLSLLKSRLKDCVVAIDSSTDACELTRINAARLGLKGERLTVLHEKICIKSVAYWWKEKFDVIISNPPYITNQDMINLQPEIACYEDRSALCGGKDGMDVIKQILHFASYSLRNSGSLWLEVGTGHTDVICKQVQEMHFGRIQFVARYQDFTKRWRFCHLKKM